MNGTELLGGVVGLGLLLGGMYGVARLVAAGLRRADVSARRTKQLAVYPRFGVMLVGVVSGIALYVRVPFLEPVVDVLAFEGGWYVWSIGHGLGLGLIALAAIYPVSRGLDPAVRDVLDQTHTVPRRYRRRRWTAHAFATLSVPVVGFSLIANGVSDVWLVAALAAVFFGWLVIRGPVVSFAYRTRDPTGEERSRIERCFDRFDRDAPTVVVFDDESEDLDVRLMGRGGVRTLWLQESLLSENGDDELAALLAAEDRKNRRRFYERTFFAFTTGIVALGSLLVALLEIAAGIGGSLAFLSVSPDRSLPWAVAGVVEGALLIGGNYRTRRVVYEADRFATSRFDPAVVRRVYDRYAETITVVDSEQVRSEYQWKLAIEPSMEDRIRRIEREHGLEPIDSSTDVNADPDAVEDVIEVSDEWTVDDDPDSDRAAVERALASMGPVSFASLVADLRAEWGRECSVTDPSGEPWVDVVATATDGTRELLRTVHRSSDEPVTVTERAFVDETGRVAYDGTADSVLVVTNGRFDDDAASTVDPDTTLVDGDRLIDLLEDAGLAERVAATTREEPSNGPNPV